MTEPSTATDRSTHKDRPPRHPRKPRRPRRRRKKGTLTPLDYLMLGFGSMVGVGWTVSSNHWLAQAGGPWPAFIGFLLGTLLLIPIGLTYGELMSALPVNGGVMTYCYRAFGSPIAFLSSWFVALAYLTILPWEAIYINRILANFIPALREGTVLYHAGEMPIYLRSVVLGIAFAVGLFLINYRGSKLAAKMQRIFSYFIIIVGFIVIVLSLVKGRFANLRPVYENIGVGSHGSLPSGILAMIVIVPFFMAGFDTIPQSVEDAHPELSVKRIARALVLSILAAGAFYAMIIITTASVSPWQGYAVQDSPAVAPLLQEAYGGLFGTILHHLVIFGTLAGLFSTWNGMFMAAARLLQSMGRAGLIPTIFAKEHKKYRTPVTASIFCLVAAAAGPFVGLSFIDPLTNLGSVAFVLGWFFTCLSALVLRYREPELRRTYAVPGGKVMLYLAVIISGVIAALTFIPGQPAFMGRTGLILFVAWLIPGIIFYLFTNGGSRGITEEERRRRIFGK